MIKKFINDYLYSNFNLSLPELNIVERVNLFFARAYFKNKEIIVPLIYGKIGNFYLLNEVYFSQVDPDDDFVVFNDEIYKKFNSTNTFIAFSRLFALDIGTSNFYFFTDRNLFVKVPRFYFSVGKLKSPYNDFFYLLEENKEKEILNRLTERKNEQFVNHILRLSNYRNL